MQKKPRKKFKMPALLRKAVERILLALLVIICIGVFYLAVILAEMPADQAPSETTPPPAAVALAPEQPRQAGALSEVSWLLETFPAPVLIFSPEAGFTFENGLTNDLAYQGSFARLVTLTYRGPNGEALILQSIYPADAYALLPGSGYEMKDALTAPLAGMTAVRMENGETVRLHVRGESALYAFTAPQMGGEALRELSRQALLIKP